MNFFRYLLYFLFALSALIFASITNSFVRRRPRSAWMTVRFYLIIVAVYATVLLATTLALPIRTINTYEAQYSGDWSIGVASIRRNPHDPDEDYELDFRLSNHGSKIINGEKKLVVYLLSENGTRYDPTPQPSEPPFDTALKPGKSVTTTRRFILPTNQNRVELVIAYAGFRFGWFIIGRTPFDGRTVVMLVQ